MKTINSLLNNHFWVILFALALVFLMSIAAGVTWGLPEFWNIDERLPRVMIALSRGLEYIPVEVYYPTLPFFIMLSVGKLLTQLPVDDLLIMVGIRMISAVLGSLVIILTALTTLIAVSSRPTALVAASLVILSSGFFTITHFAHVDIYLTFFTTLTAFLLLKFTASSKESWLYLGFFVIGLATSSKFNGATLLLAATLIAILFAKEQWRYNLLRLSGRMALAYFLSFLGFFIGTPQAILNAPSYLDQLMPFLERQREYAGPRPIGIVGQWGNMLNGLGPLLLLLVFLATIWALIQAVKYISARIEMREISSHGRFYLALLLILFAFELPIALSRFYPLRYMVPAYPLLTVLSALMLHDWWIYSEKFSNKAGKLILLLAISAVMFFSALRIVSVILLFDNDGRVAAAGYLRDMIPPGTRTEHTYYPPQLPEENRVIDNYPMVVFRFEEDISPHTGTNMGGEGIEIRKPEYLVVDSKTIERFEDDYVCRINPVECQFFTRLLNDETNYKLKRRFAYRAPPYLPQVPMGFVNVDVLVYERRVRLANSLEEATWRHSIDAQFGDNILLLGYDFTLITEDQFEITLYWITDARMAENYKVFVHCLNPEDGQIVTQSDSIPANGTSPTEYWLRGEIIKDEHILELPAGYAGSGCQLQVGLFLPETGERLPALLKDKALANDAIPLQRAGEQN